MTPPASDSQMQMQQQQQGRLLPLKPQVHHGLPMPQPPGGLGVPLVAMKGQGSSGPGSMGGVPAAYSYPAYQSHLEQLGKLTRPLLSYFF